MQPVLMPFKVIIAGLDSAVAEAPTTKGHVGLLRTVRSIPCLEGAKLLMERDTDGGSWLRKHRVFDDAGNLVHEDLDALLASETHALGGNAAECMKVLSDRKLTVARTLIGTLYLTVDRQDGDQDDYLQIKITHSREVGHHRLFGDSWYSRPRDFDDLIDYAQSHIETPVAELPLLSPPAYRAVEVIHVSSFVNHCAELANADRLALSQRSYALINRETGDRKVKTHSEIDPDFDRFPVRERRFFQDWRDSSAGRSGARVSDHWALQFSAGEYAIGNGRKQAAASFVPMNAFPRQLAKVDATKLDDHALFSKLEKLNQRVGVPFGWYFFMLHGNWVRDGAGHRILKAAEAGILDLPEHDYQILRRWARRGYGF